MCLGLLRRRAEWKAAIAADARRLIESFQELAYFEARERVRGRCIDGGRPARHWTAVKLEIARRQGISIGLAGADLRARDAPRQDLRARAAGSSRLPLA